MKKSLLTLTAALFVSSSVFALEIDNPFYQPEKGKFLSDTSLAYQNFDDGKSDDVLALENLTYGITNRFAVIGTLADVYNMDGRLKKRDNFVNPAWGLGVKYNLIDNAKTDLTVQVGADYTQGTMSLTPMLASGAFFNHRSKAFSGFVKAGYKIDKYTPYVSTSIIKPVGKYEEDPYLSFRGAVYAPVADKVTVDAGLDYIFGTGTKGNDKHVNVLGFDASVNYALSDKITVGGTIAYVIDTEPTPEFEFDYYTFGANLKIAF